MITDQFCNDVADCLDEVLHSHFWYNSRPGWQNKVLYNYVAVPLYKILRGESEEQAREGVREELAELELPFPEYLEARLRKSLPNLREKYVFNLDQTIDSLLGVGDQYMLLAREFNEEKKVYERRKLLKSICAVAGAELGLNLSAVRYGTNFFQVLRDLPAQLFILVTSGAVGILAYYVQHARDGSLMREINCRYLGAEPERKNSLLDIEQNPPHLADKYISETKALVAQALTQS